MSTIKSPGHPTSRPQLVWVVSAWCVLSSTLEIILWVGAISEAVSGETAGPRGVDNWGYWIAGVGSSVAVLCAGLTFFMLRAVSLVFFAAGVALSLLYVVFKVLWFSELGPGPTSVGAIPRLALVIGVLAYAAWLRRRGELRG